MYIHVYIYIYIYLPEPTCPQTRHIQRESEVPHNSQTVTPETSSATCRHTCEKGEGGR